MEILKQELNTIVFIAGYYPEKIAEIEATQSHDKFKAQNDEEIADLEEYKNRLEEITPLVNATKKLVEQKIKELERKKINGKDDTKEIEKWIHHCGRVCCLGAPFWRRVEAKRSIRVISKLKKTIESAPHTWIYSGMSDEELEAEQHIHDVFSEISAKQRFYKATQISTCHCCFGWEIYRRLKYCDIGVGKFYHVLDGTDETERREKHANRVITNVLKLLDFVLQENNDTIQSAELHVPQLMNQVRDALTLENAI